MTVGMTQWPKHREFPKAIAQWSTEPWGNDQEPWMHQLPPEDLCVIWLMAVLHKVPKTSDFFNMLSA